ncbi:MAG: SDR family NAD(P)-dependent oxidoreductase [Alphaproteobacteria bacterium]|nr:SDR family NAD(P)-dependent oxidoreductase [Alphaproteobacteria bacterium]
MDKNILITGGAGFIGSHTAEALLERGEKVIVLDNFNDFYDPKVKENNVAPHLEDPNYKLIRADIRDNESLAKTFTNNKIDAVIHIAALAGVRPSIDRPKDYIETNIIGTLNIIEQMRIHNVKKLIFASSSSVYGNCKADKFSENLDVSEPISPYAMTKKSCEELITVYHKLYNINAVCLRFFTVYGPRQRPDLAINKFAGLIESGQPIPVFGDGSNRRDYTFVADIVCGILAALDYNKTGFEIINLGGGDPVSLERMINVLESTLGKKAVIDRKPMQPGDVDKTVCDWEKANRLLGYAPKVNFESGITEFVKWLRSR